MAVAVAVYGGWLLVLASHSRLPWPVTAVLLGVLVAWHSSLQHEVIHGHPFRVRWANDALAMAPLALWVPYPRYRALHLRHHRDEHLTDPLEDPESTYLTPGRWDAMHPAARALTVANRTLLGRVVLGPILATVGWWRSEVQLARAGDAAVRRAWARHLPAALAVAVVAVAVAGMPLWLYLLGAVYLSRSFALVRSFCEHRWVGPGAGRTAVVRAGRFWSLLFLHNNLHHAHHARPGVAWYRLPALAASLGSDDEARRGGGWYAGYGAVARRYGVRPFCQPVHPAMGAATEHRTA